MPLLQSKVGLGGVFLEKILVANGSVPKVGDAVDAMSNKAGTWEIPEIPNQATKSIWLSDLDGILTTSECITLDSWYVWHTQFFPEDVEKLKKKQALCFFFTLAIDF